MLIGISTAAPTLVHRHRVVSLMAVRFFLFGRGEVAPVTGEVIREAEPDRAHRPRVHVG
ncbi:hypothetical protein [Streptomyces formicae]|uniref:Uncharacterized protein n=1 Tax=Streptomyces formicae TaxID=1616117 RepID=A0ABY3X271_9ACTN|nr:hypothetical protein [Streptomyces formicae]UNM16910.1 hypothetical protein J4032_10355 [Streptomyces formicae]